MRIPPNAIIPDDKLTKYLLLPRRRSDKSKFLSRAGFTASRPADLEAAIRRSTACCDAIVDRVNEFGRFYRVEAELMGPNGVVLDAVLIWIEWMNDGSFHFVTLKPGKSTP